MAEEHSRAQQRRTDYINWDQYFMGIALLSENHSKDPNRQVGACIINNDKKIVGVGYNGMPWGCHDDEFPWNQVDPTGDIEEKYFYVCHAELNAIVNKNSCDLKDCTMYVTLFPCNECTKLIIQSGIKKIIYLSNDKAREPKWRAAKRMLDAAGVEYRPYVHEQDKPTMMTLNFNARRKTAEDD